MDKNMMLETMFRVIDVGICVTDENNRFVLVNDAYCKLYGYCNDELVGSPFTIIVPEELKSDVLKRHQELLHGGPDASGEWKVIKKSGEMIDILTSAALFIDKSGKRYIVTTVQDITHTKKSKEYIEYLSKYSSLTNLPNRSYFARKLEAAIEEVKRSNRKVAMLYINIDRFKLINDNFGYQYGDMILQAFSLRLKEIFQEDDALGYFGTDKFGALVRNVLPDQDITNLTNYIKKRMREPLLINNRTIKIGCSIGISFFPDESKSVEELFKNSESAMLKAKNSGRNLSYIYNRKMDKTIRRRRQIETDLENALLRKELFLVYQPQINLNTGSVCGVEALIRWKHPTLGMVPPSEFIPIAEETGAIQRIGDWTLLEVCRQSAKWANMGIDLMIALNISSLQLMRNDFSQRVIRLTTRYRIKPDRLELELTERSIIEDIENTIVKIRQLRKIGIKFSIDDFGTGYSSLNYLRRLPLDKLKIDKSFIDDIITDSNSSSVAKTIIDMAHNLSFKVIAEGVETTEQKEFLTNNGCDEMQGFLISRPLSVDETEQFIINC